MTRVRALLNNLMAVENKPVTVSDNLRSLLQEAKTRIEYPIDSSVARYLAPDEPLIYPPNRLEYLAKSLSDCVSACIDLRNRAQELEVRYSDEMSRQLTQIRIVAALSREIELWKAHEPLIISNASSVKSAAGSISIESSDRGYWDNAATERLLQGRIIADVAYERIRQMDEPGSALNFVERFNQLETIFKLRIRELHRRARSFECGLRRVFLVAEGEEEGQLPSFRSIRVDAPGYVNSVASWTRKAMALYEWNMIHTTEFTVCLSVKKLMTGDAFNAARVGRAYQFAISPEHLGLAALRYDPRLRAVGLTVRRTEDVTSNDPLQVSLETPVDRWDHSGPGTYELPTVRALGLLAYPNESPLAAAALQGIEDVQYLSPVGQWRLQIHDSSVLGKPANADNGVQDILLSLRLSSRTRLEF